MARAPEQRGYRSQVDPSGGARLGGASPEAFGAGVGAEIERAGRGLEQRALEARRLELQHERDRQMSAAAVAFAEAQGKIAAEEDAAFEAPPEAGEGLETTLEERRRRIFEEEFLSTISNEDVRNHFAPMVARAAVTSRDRTRGAVIALRAKKTKADGTVIIEQSANQARSRPEAELDTVLRTLDTFADANIKDPVAIKAFKRQGRQEILTGHARGIGDKAGGEAMLRYVTSDALSAIFDPDQIDTLRNEAESLINQERVKADRQAREAAARQQEEEATFVTGASAGLPVDVAAGVRLAAQARARGDTSKALQIDIHTESARTTNALQDALVPQITEAIAAIEAQPKWRDNPTLVLRHKAASDLRERKRREEPNIVEPDWNDPASIGRFRQQVRTWSATNQVRPKFIFGDHGKKLKDLYAASPQGRREVLEAIGRLGDQDGFSAAQELAPDDQVFQLAATLQGRPRELAMAGKEALATVKDATVGSNAKLHFQRQALPALRGFDAAYGQAAQEGALAIYATMLQRQGKAGWDKDVYAQALNMALGASERGGGLGEWRDAPMVLPDDMGQAEFDKLLSRQSGLANAYYDDTDGKRRQLTWDQVRRNFTILTVGDGLYQFVDFKGRPVLAGDGTPAQLNIRSKR